MANLGRNLLMQKRWVDAEPVIRESLKLRQKSIKPDDPAAWQIASTSGMLGEALMGRALSESSAALLAEAEPYVLKAAESLPGDDNVPKPPAGMPDRKRDALDRAVRLYEAWLKVEADPAREAMLAEWREKLEAFDKSR